MLMLEFWHLPSAAIVQQCKRPCHIDDLLVHRYCLPCCAQLTSHACAGCRASIPLGIRSTPSGRSTPIRSVYRQYRSSRVRFTVCTIARRLLICCASSRVGVVVGRYAAAVAAHLSGWGACAAPNRALVLIVSLDLAYDHMHPAGGDTTLHEHFEVSHV